MNLHHQEPQLQDGHQRAALYGSNSTDTQNALECAEEDLYSKLKIDNKTKKLRKQWSGISDSDETSENFLTPPTSPMLSPGHPNRALEETLTCEDSPSTDTLSPSVDTSPLLKWKHNPLYEDSVASKQPASTDIYSVQVTGNVSVGLQNELNDLNRGSSFHRSHRSRQRSRTIDNCISTPKLYNSDHTSSYNPSIGSYTDNDVFSAPNSPFRNGALLDANSNNENTAFIDLNAFPDDAPDNTLIKPSKLRESMRRGKLKRPAFMNKKAQMNGDTNNNNSSTTETVTTAIPVALEQNNQIITPQFDIRNYSQPARTQNYAVSAKTQHYTEPARPLTFSEPVKSLNITVNKDSTLQDDIVHDISDDQFMSTNSSFTDSSYSTLEPQTNEAACDTLSGTSIIGDVVVDCLDDTVMTPSKFRESMRRKKRLRNKESSINEEETVSDW